MAVKRQRLLLLGALLALVAVLAPVSGARTSATVQATLYVEYTMDCRFTIVDDQGKTITSIAPGNYQLDVRTPVPFGTMPKNYSDMTACKGMVQFQIVGPGLNFATTVSAGCEADEVTTHTFLPSATYNAQDNNQPSVARFSFTTLASGTPPKANAGYQSSSFGQSSASQDIVGSGLRPKATLTGALTSNGKLSLTSKGKAVTEIKTGHYTFAITDQDARHSFSILGPKSKNPVNLTGVTFTGKRSVVVTLTAGRWTYLAGLGQVHYFTVER